jgi:hypothetical protein
MANKDKDFSDKKSSRRARVLTSGQLREETKKKSSAASKPVDGRLITVEIWGRGNNNPLMRAFISEYKNQRTVKRTAAAWIELFRVWKAKPRG